MRADDRRTPLKMHDPFTLPIMYLGNAFVALYVVMAVTIRRVDRLLMALVLCFFIGVNGKYFADLGGKWQLPWNAVYMASNLSIIARIRKLGSL